MAHHGFRKKPILHQHPVIHNLSVTNIHDTRPVSNTRANTHLFSEGFKIGMSIVLTLQKATKADDHPHHLVQGGGLKGHLEKPLL